MSENPSTKPEHSSFHFQMWDQYLKILNQVWDLETTWVDLEQGRSSSSSHFREALWNENLLELNRSWQVELKSSPPPPKSWLDYLLFPLKKLVFRWIYAYLNPVFSYQREFNARTVRTFNKMVDYLNIWICKVENQKEFNAKVVQCLNALVDHLDGQIFRYLERESIPELRQRIHSCLQDYHVQNLKIERVLAFLTSEVDHALLSREIKEELIQYQKEIEDHKYLQFESQFRGPSREIKNRQAIYIPFFRQCQQVLDIGCGRGEFLELMKENHIGGYGIDVNKEMILCCLEKGLKAETTDAIAHLDSLADSSLDGIFSSQVIEHLDPNALIHLLKLCYAKLKPNAYIVLETVNTSSVLPFLLFFLDLSHKTLLHPQTMEFLMNIHGFTDIEIRYTSPVPDVLKLSALDETIEDPNLQRHFQIMNKNIEKLNTFLFGYLDYAIVARKRP